MNDRAASASDGGGPLTVIAHVFYTDIWREMSDLLAERLQVPFRLIVTTPHEPDAIALPHSPFLLSSRIVMAENRGRDVLPFLKVLREDQTVDLGLKLHTKRSPHRPDGDSWRRAVVEALLPPPPESSAFVAALRRDPRIGLVIAEGFLAPLRGRLGDNLPKMRAAAAATGIPVGPDTLARARFPAGAMFWFRRQALESLCAPELEALFEEEAGQLDATAAHAVERLFAVAAEAGGCAVLPTNALLKARPESSLEELRGLAARHAWLSPHARVTPAALAGLKRLFPRLAPVYRALPESWKRLLRS